MGKNTNISIYLYLLLMLWITSTSSCKKYVAIAEMQGPAYLRVYNNIPYIQDVMNKDFPRPFLTMLINPKLDKEGVPYDAEVIGDYLDRRQLYSISYPLNAGNVFQKINYDWPGNMPVLTAPPLNGFDLSAWAQVKAGTTRIMFVVRPFTDTSAFVRLPLRERKKIIIDTTIDFSAGELYTLEAVMKDFDQRDFGAYVRKESFIHGNFDADKLYLSMYNLSGNTVQTLPGTTLLQTFARDSMKLNYTYLQYDPLQSAPSASSYVYAVVLPYLNIPLPSLTKRFQTSAPFVPVPMLPSAMYRKQDGSLLAPGVPKYPGFNSELFFLGEMPYIAFNAIDQSGVLLKPDDSRNYSFHSCADRGVINEYTMQRRSGSGDNSVVTGQLTMPVNKDGTTLFQSSLNIFEFVYDRVYHIQVQRLAADAPGR